MRSSLYFILGVVALMICIPGTKGLVGAAMLGTLDVPIRTQVSKTYGKLPLSFEVNRGQTVDEVKFLSRGSGYTLFLTAREAILSLSKRDAPKLHHTIIAGKPPVPVEDTQTTVPTVLRMKLVGANPAPQMVGLDKLPGESNYFIGNDPKNWHTSIPTYAKVRYQDVYPGVDMLYYGNQGQLEYDFVVFLL